MGSGKSKCLEDDNVSKMIRTLLRERMNHELKKKEEARANYEFLGCTYLHVVGKTLRYMVSSCCLLRNRGVMRIECSLRS